MRIKKIARRSRVLSLSFFLVIACLLVVPPAYSYEEVDVKNGGLITGKVTAIGEKPSPRYFPLALFPFAPFCKRISDGQGNVALQEFIMGPEGGLQDAVVSVQNVEKGKPFPPIKAEFAAINCMFHPADVSPTEHSFLDDEGTVHHEHPLVTVLENNRPMTVVNQDPVIHNAQVFQKERGNIVLNVALPPLSPARGGVVRFHPDKKIFQLICGMHEFMQGWGLLVDNPYYAKTKKTGEFTIDNLPPGTYKVIAWHPHLKPIEREVTVSAEGNAVANFEFDMAEVKRPQYESQKEFRIGPEALPHKHLKDLKEGERIKMD